MEYTKLLLENFIKVVLLIKKRSIVDVRDKTFLETMVEVCKLRTLLTSFRGLHLCWSSECF